MVEPKGIGKAIERLRRERGLQNKQVAERAGISAAYLTEIKTGEKNPTLEILRSLAGALQVPLTTLVEEEEAPQSTQYVQLVGPGELANIDEEVHELAPIPRITSDKIAAGPPRIVYSEEVEGYVFVPRQMLKTRPELYICMTVAGRSMEPTIPNGARVGINRSEQHPPYLHRRVVALSTEEGGATIKRLYWQEPYVLGIPDNLTADEEKFDMRDFNPVVGRVDWVWYEL